MTKKKLLIIIITVLGCSQFFLRGEYKKFELEISGNYIFANPGHLNYLPETELQFLSFYLDPVYENKNEDGSIDPIKALYSIHTRFKFVFTPSVNISVGFSYLWRNQINKYNVIYTRDEGWRTISDELDYPDMTTQIRGVIPSIGFHYRIPISQKMKVECSLIGGPLFVTIDYSKNVTQSISSVYDSSFPFWSSETSTTMDGKGTGISLTGSFKLEKELSRSLGVFFESGFTFQRVANIEGDGSETINGNSTDFSGEWGLMVEDVKTNRGETQFIFPTNNWTEFGQKQDDFILDLSGFFITLGINFKL